MTVTYSDASPFTVLNPLFVLFARYLRCWVIWKSWRSVLVCSGCSSWLPSLFASGNVTFSRRRKSQSAFRTQMGENFLVQKSKPYPTNPGYDNYAICYDANEMITHYCHEVWKDLFFFGKDEDNLSSHCEVVLVYHKKILWVWSGQPQLPHLGGAARPAQARPGTTSGRTDWTQSSQAELKRPVCW